MISGLLVMGGLGVVVGVGLALASKIFYVYVDPKIEAVDEALPGANCGGCGLPGCSSNAVAIVKGDASPGSCVAAGDETAEEIAGILGVSLEAREPDIAKSGCTYGFQDADLKYEYDGLMDCRAAALLGGGSKVCPVGCLGLGTCVKACPFDALSMGDDNLPVVNLEKCTGCGTCERVCPKYIITLSSYTRRIMGEYVTDECTAPCQRSCPAGIDIPSYIGKIQEKNYIEAVRVIKEANPFPGVCGRICVHPCEFECRRNLVDEPVAINYLKRFVSDYERNSGQRVHIPRAPETDKRLAVVGGGAEGLTAAYFLNRLGHEVTLYEGSKVLGGLLRSGLPENRLPRDLLDWEIDGILDAGIKAEKETKLGKDISVASLIKEGNQAVFVAAGGWDTHVVGKGEDYIEPLPGVQMLIDYLMGQKTGKEQPVGENVLILGGGKAAKQAASACLKQGAQKVLVISRKSKDLSPFTEEEIAGLEKEGVEFYFDRVVTRMMGESDKLTHVELVSLIGNEESEIVLINTLMTGAGRFPELIYIPRQKDEVSEEDVPTEEWETLIPYPSPIAEQDLGIFRPGEVIGDYKAIVEAIGAGRRAASSIQKYITGEPVAAPENMIRNSTRVLNLNEVEPVAESPRENMPEQSEEERLNNPSSEIAKGFSETQAKKEADRCLQCGLICYRRHEGTLH